MTTEEILSLIQRVQRDQCESADLEVKSARGGAPTDTLARALSAFANRNGGGVILLGIDEKSRFAIAGVGDPNQVAANVADICANLLQPPLKPEIEVADLGGKKVIAVRVTELPADQRPCFISAKGVHNGTFVRSGPTNRKATDYDISVMYTSRTQPAFDETPVLRAGIDDLDGELLAAHHRRMRRSRRLAPYLDAPGTGWMVKLGILHGQDDGIPTLAGLLMFGSYPQQFEPQLRIVFVQYFGADRDESAPDGARFIDNQSFEGPIPAMADTAVVSILSRLRQKSLIAGLVRTDIPEYPEIAVREAVLNAIAHRDYSANALGTAIHVRLFADRMEIESPGGLYGQVTIETLEEQSSTRNRKLMRLLEDAGLVENRGSGVRAMILAMRDAHLGPPEFMDTGRSFIVRFRNHTLLPLDAVAWLNQFARVPLNDRQRMALVQMKTAGVMTNRAYRALCHVDATTAMKELAALEKAGVAIRRGKGRGVTYSLAGPDSISQPGLTPEESVVQLARKAPSITSKDIQKALGLTGGQTSGLLRQLVAQGVLIPVGERRWRTYHLSTLKEAATGETS